MISIKGFSIDPRFQINYSSFYIKGMVDLVGWRNFTFDLNPFFDEISVTSRTDYMKGMAFVAKMADGTCKKVFVDTFDSDKIHEPYYLWCDVYAKVNVKASDLSHSKLIAIGPSFGIQLWNPLKTMLTGVSNYCKARKAQGYLPSLREFLTNYAYTFVRRRPYADYVNTPSEVDTEYVFSLHTLWYDDLTYSTTNKFRGEFIRCCRKIYKTVEGGFFYIYSNKVEQAFPKYKQYLVEYKDMLYCKRMGMREYLARTRKSHIVFNSPSVEGCLGWKLGEYLAMGKVILSMPLRNEMPGVFENGVHYLQVKSAEDIEAKINALRADRELYDQLSSAAKRYFEEFMAPQRVIERVLSHGER